MKSCGVCGVCSNDFHKIWWKGAHGAWRKPLDFGGNTSRYVRLGVG